MPSPESAPRTFTQLLPQLFLFPLLIVTVAVLIWLLFIASAQDNRSVDELIADLQSGGRHGRHQDAYALAQKAVDLSRRQQWFTEAETRKLLALVEKGEEACGDSELFQFLTLAAGRGGKPELTVPVMASIALAETNSEPARMHAVRALGLSRSDEAAAALKTVVQKHAGPEGWEFRWNALAGLANLRDANAVPLLRIAVNDPRREISWSAACWLANTFQDGSGLEILERIMDWDYLDEQRGDRKRELTGEEKENYMLMALDGLAALKGREALSLLEEKSRDRRSLKVRNLAIKLKNQLHSNSNIQVSSRSELAGGI